MEGTIFDSWRLLAPYLKRSRKGSTVITVQNEHKHFWNIYINTKTWMHLIFVVNVYVFHFFSYTSNVQSNVFTGAL